MNKPNPVTVWRYFRGYPIESGYGVTMRFVLDYEQGLIYVSMSFCNGDNFSKTIGRRMIEDGNCFDVMMAMETCMTLENDPVFSVPDNGLVDYLIENLMFCMLDSYAIAVPSKNIGSHEFFNHSGREVLGDKLYQNELLMTGTMLAPLGGGTQEDGTVFSVLSVPVINTFKYAKIDTLRDVFPTKDHAKYYNAVKFMIEKHVDATYATALGMIGSFVDAIGISGTYQPPSLLQHNRGATDYYEGGFFIDVTDLNEDQKLCLIKTIEIAFKGEFDYDDQ